MVEPLLDIDECEDFVSHVSKMVVDSLCRDGSWQGVSAGTIGDPVVFGQKIEPVGEMRLPVTKASTRVAELLSGYCLTGWHQTRVLDVSQVREYGLLGRGPEDFESHVLRLAKYFQLSSRQASMGLDQALRYYRRDERRRDGVCFYSTRQVESEFLQYSDSVGGETFRWAIESLGDAELIAAIEAAGTPIAVKLVYPFWELGKAEREKVALGVVRSSLIRHCCGVFVAPRY